MIVITIIIILAAITWALVGPGAKERARLTEIRSNLRQVAASINVYMTDWDGYAPPRLDDLVPAEMLRDPNSCVPYVYIFSFGELLEGGQRPSDYGFSESSDPVIYATTTSRNLRKYDVMEYPCPDGRTGYYKVPLLDIGEANELMAARLDGSTDYFRYPPDWMENLPETEAPPAE